MQNLGFGLDSNISSDIMSLYTLLDLDEKDMMDGLTQ